MSCLDMHMTTYYGFTGGASWHTCNLALTTWILYSPTDELVNLRGVCLVSATNNIVEYQAVIGLLADSFSQRVKQLIVYLDSQLAVSHLNRIYTISDPTLILLYLWVRLLERSFVFIRYQHIPRYMNMVVDSQAIFILNWHIAHFWK